MKKLKNLTVFNGETVAKFQNVKPADGSPTPIDLNEETKEVVVHFGALDKMHIDLSKVVMYRYEEEAQVTQ